MVKMRYSCACGLASVHLPRRTRRQKAEPNPEQTRSIRSRPEASGRCRPPGRPRATWLAVPLLLLVALPLALGESNVAYGQSERTPQIAVPSSWSLKPSDLSVGDSFRLIFISTTTTEGAVASVDDYDTIVQDAAAAGHADIQGFGLLFRAVVSTSTEDARDHIDATGNGMQINWLNGHSAATNYADFFDSRLEQTPKNQNGITTSGNYWTGSNDDGTKFQDQWVGSTVVRYGNANSGLDRADASYDQQIHLLGISPIFVVRDDTSAPHITSLTIVSPPPVGAPAIMPARPSSLR